MNKKLTVTIPIKTNDFSYFKFLLSKKINCNLKNSKILLIDDNSPKKTSDEIYKFSKENDIEYTNTNSDSFDFNLSRCRNTAINIANTEYIYFDDIDIIYNKNFFTNLIRQLVLIENTFFNYLTIPVIYWSKKKSEEILTFDNEIFDDQIQNIEDTFFLNDIKDTNLFQNYYKFSGLLALKTKIAKIFKFNEIFNKWGGEDREFIFKLIKFNMKLTKPENLGYSCNTSDVGNKYNCWRDFHYLVGEYVEKKKLVGHHMFHENRKWKINFNSNTKENELNTKNLLMSKKIINFYQQKNFFFPEYKAKAKYIILGYNPFIVNAQILEVLGDYKIISDRRDQVPEIVYEEIVNSDPEAVFMWNPYGNELRLKVYEILISNNIKTYVVERGALPDSFYFDQNGFCVNSNSYSLLKNDNLKLSFSKIRDTINYINSIIKNNETLEKQNHNETLFEKLKIKKKKYLLVCYQLDYDTATNNFIKDKRTYIKFIEETKKIDKAQNSKIDGWQVLYKNHPLTANKLNLENSIKVDDININQLIQIVDAILVFNSGVGLISMINKKKVYYYGECFYALKDVNEKYDSFENFIDSLKKKQYVDFKKVINFIYSLRNFYSYAEVNYFKKNPNKKFRMANKINYYKVNILGITNLTFKKLIDIKNTLLFKDIFDKKLTSDNNKKTFIKYNNKAIFINKIVKLIKKPKLFFIDSWLFKIFKKK